MSKKDNDSGVTISIIVDGKEHVYNTDELLRINQVALSDEFAGQAARYGYFAAMAAGAEATYRAAKRRTEIVYAEADEELRREFAESESGRKVTEAVVKAAIMLDEDYCSAVEQELEALYNYKLLQALVNAFEQRASMLQSLGAHIRHEYDMTDMHILEDPADRLSREVKKTIRKRRSSSKQQV